MGNSDETSIKTTAPRREATPQLFDKLTEAQRDVLRQTWELVRFFLYDGDTPTHSRFRAHEVSDIGFALPPIGHERRRTAVLIEGRRGSGKTTVLVTLLDAWNRAARQRARAGEHGALTDFCDPDGRIVPLGLLDLRSVPTDTTLLLHVSSLFARLVDYLGAYDHDRAPATAPQRDQDSALRGKWEAYYQAVASMELKVQNRGRSLDPESFADELRMTGRDRVDFARMFGELFDEIIDEYGRREDRQRGQTRRPPLFVIAIDDADMSPARVGECFELLERLEHPRLVFLLTGDTDLFKAALRAQFVGELQRPLGPAHALDQEFLRNEIIGPALNLAKLYYDKMIPRGHRFGLAELSVLDRNERLAEELAQVKAGDTSLAEIIERLPVLGELFPPTIREIEDLRAALRSLARGDHAAIRVLVHLRDHLLERLPLARPVERVLEQVVQLRPVLFPRPRETKPHMDTSGFGIELSLAPGGPLPLASEGGEPSLLMLQVPTELAIKIKGAKVAVDPVSAGLLVLVSYVRGLLESGDFSPLAVPSVDSPWFAARILQMAEDLVVVPWPVAEFDGLALVEFSRHWERVIERAELEEPLSALQLEWLLVTYLQLVHTCARGFHGDLSTGLSARRPDALQRAWEELAKQARNDHERCSILRAATPEVGLSHEAATRVIEAVRASGGAWSRTLEVTRDLRAEALNKRNQKIDALAVLEQVDAAAGDHPWNRAQRIPLPKSFSNPLIELLDKMGLPPHESGAAWRAAKVSDYLSDDLRDEISRADSEETEVLVRIIQAELDAGRRPDRALFQGWLSVRQTDHRHTHKLRAGDFQVNASILVEIEAGPPMEV